MNSPLFSHRVFAWRMLALLVFGLLPVWTVTAHAGDVEDVRAADLKRIRALVNGDRETLNSVLADELSYGHSDGRRQSKAELLTALSAGAITYQSYDGPSPDVRVYGETGVMSGMAELRATAGGKAVKFRLRYLAVYAKRNGAWVLVAYQSAPLDPPQPAASP